jgi:hypothetical protein
MGMTKTQKRRWQRRRQAERLAKEEQEKEQEEQKGRAKQEKTKGLVKRWVRKDWKGETEVTTTSTDPKGTESKGVQFGSLPDRVSINMAFTLPLTFGAKPGQPSVMDGDVIEVEENCPEIGIASVEETMRPTDSEEQDDESAKIVLTKPSEGMSQHLRPLYISAHFDGKPLPRVLVDNGAAVNVLPASVMRKIGKLQYLIL